MPIIRDVAAANSDSKDQDLETADLEGRGQVPRPRRIGCAGGVRVPPAGFCVTSREDRVGGAIRREIPIRRL